MTSQAIRRRALLLKNFAQRKKTFTREFRFKEALKYVKIDLEHVLSNKQIMPDLQYLRRLCINIKQLSHEASKIKDNEKSRASAERALQFVKIAWGAPHISTISLLEASDHFSHQDPFDSDLFHLLSTLSWYGPTYKKLILGYLKS
jgi:hypothetical protein